MSQGGFQVMQFPVFHQPTHQPAIRQQEIPQRVQVAMEFLGMMMVKGRKEAAVSPLSIEIIDGQTLTDEEANAQATACNLLSKYFAGTVEMTAAEAADYQAYIRRESSRPGGGVIIHCVACTGNEDTRANCRLCNGSGKIIVNPVNAISGG